MTTANHVNAGFISCHTCGKVAQFVATVPDNHHHCPRCGGRLHRRLPNSLQRTWAFLIASVILYIPANLYPAMALVQFGNGEPQTIWSGTVMLYEEGYVGIATIVFVASIVIPTIKIVGLAALLISVHWRSQWQPRTRTHIYHWIDGIGRWSMLDLFVVSIMTALVRLGYPATIVPGVGASFFGAVVFLTMFAALSFDPRLVWDQNSDD